MLRVELHMLAADRVDVLVTRISFPAGQPNGVSLALMALRKCPGVKILFAARQESERYTTKIGRFLPTPVATADIVAAVAHMLVAEEMES